MKKFSVIISLALFLVACNKNNSNEVTAEMLVGDWECNPLVQQVGQFDDEMRTIRYEDDKDNLNNIGQLAYMSYKKLENDMHNYLEYTYRAKENSDYMYLQKIFSPKTITKSVRGKMEFSFYQEYHYINENEFKLDSKNEVHTFDQDGITLIDGNGRYFELACSRIIK